MKTTVEISDGLLNEARRAAARERTTVRALIEEGLRKVIGERRSRGRFQLRKASVGGRGLHPDVAGIHPGTTRLPRPSPSWLKDEARAVIGVSAPED